MKTRWSRRQIVSLGFFLLAFSYIESSVVLYLQRAFFSGASVVFPLRNIDMRYMTIEIFREAATILLLVAVAALIATGRWRLLWTSVFLFAGWDILYYSWLWILSGWPSTLTDWDVLFLIPVPWLAPVWAPLLLAALMVGCCVAMIILNVAAIRWLEFCLCAVGVLLVLWSFMYDTLASFMHGVNTLAGFVPREFHWGLYCAGVLLWGGAMTNVIARHGRHRRLAK